MFCATLGPLSLKTAALNHILVPKLCSLTPPTHKLNFKLVTSYLKKIPSESLIKTVMNFFSEHTPILKSWAASIHHLTLHYHYTIASFISMDFFLIKIF